MNVEALGKRHGRAAAAAYWQEFLKTADAGELPFTRTAALDVASAAAADRCPSRHPSDIQAFIGGYADALEAALSKKIASLIPPRIRERIHHFCFLAFWVETEKDAHPEEDIAAYGISLGLAPEGSRAELRPSQVVSTGRRSGKAQARRDWDEFLRNAEPIPGKIQWSDHHRYLAAAAALARDYQLPEERRAEWHRLHDAWSTAWGEAYRKEIAVLVRSWMPPAVRRRAKHVCALAERMGLHMTKFGWTPTRA